MQTAGIVVMCLFGGAFFALILGALVYLIYLQRQTATAQKELIASLTSAQASFTGTRAEITKSLSRAVADIQTAMSRVDATALETASVRALQACLRIEKAGNMLVATIMASQDDEEDTTPASHLGPEEYGPEETYVHHSPVARADANLQAEEAAENAPRFAQTVE